MLGFKLYLSKNIGGVHRGIAVECSPRTNRVASSIPAPGHSHITLHPSCPDGCPASISHIRVTSVALWAEKGPKTQNIHSKNIGWNIQIVWTMTLNICTYIKSYFWRPLLCMSICQSINELTTHFIPYPSCRDGFCSLTQ